LWEAEEDKTLRRIRIEKKLIEEIVETKIVIYEINRA
jgi:hypothetical protein